LKNLIFSQTNDKFDENSTWSTFKYPNHEIQSKILKSLSKIKKLDSFFNFHTKRPKLQNREMPLVAVIQGFDAWNFAGDITMNHINDFLLIQQDLSPSKHPIKYGCEFFLNKLAQGNKWKFRIIFLFPALIKNFKCIFFRCIFLCTW
jgi:hypothetical protein